MEGDYRALLLRLVVLRGTVEDMAREMGREKVEREELLAMIWALQADNMRLKRAALERRDA